MSIEILPQEVVEKIAAGEVLERPANLVKELVENSLDAGAKSVEIEFDQGGRRVQVTDDGAGMSDQDLSLALRRHATSKIKTDTDIWSLETFGFRGEALASISAVSRMTLRSRDEHAKSASRLMAHFGVPSEIESIGGSRGTMILVEDLFENTPARLKFLKSEAAEAAQIKKVLKALALESPFVSFRVKSKGQMVAFWPARDDLKSRAEQVLEVKPLYHQRGSVNGVEVEIAFSSPSQVNRTSQEIWILVQGRFVQDKTIQAAVMDAYRNLLMHGEYPTVVVSVRVPVGDVDVNVHPTKAQVKFKSSSEVFRAVHRVLRTALEKAPWAPASMPVGGAGTSEEPIALSTHQVQETLGLGVEGERTFFKQKTDLFVEAAKAEYKASQVSDVVAPSKSVFWSNLQILGQANQTYILAQSRDALFIIDQHASHERVLFEKIFTQVRSGGLEIQNFLLPHIIELTPEQMELVWEHRLDLERFGLGIDQGGPTTLQIRSAPAVLKTVAIEKAVLQFASELQMKGGSFSFEKKIGDICATMACHSAIRAGDALSFDQMTEVLKLMDHFPLSGYCPHGRPVYTETTFQQLDRSFGRIV